MKNIPALLLAFLFIASCGKSGSSTTNPPGPANISDTVLLSNLDFPWEILWGPDNFIWMTQRGGIISRVNPATGVVSPLLTINEVVPNGEGGLLGMVLHPDFTANPFLYVAYDYNKAGNYTEKIVRYIYSGGALISPTIIFDNIKASSIHNGCRLRIGPDLKLYFSTGDANNPTDAQDTAMRNGKIMRLNLDGTIPADNPFPNNPIWSYGHRNPQGLVFVNNKLFNSEHGPDTDDEINIIQKGKNFGWPDVRGFCDLSAEQTFCSSHNVVEPIQAWTPTIAPSGTEYYNNDKISQWKNSLLLCTLKDSRLIQLQLNDTQDKITAMNEFFINKYGRLRDACVSPSGDVYLCTSNGGGTDQLIKVFGK